VKVFSVFGESKQFVPRDRIEVAKVTFVVYLHICYSVVMNKQKEKSEVARALAVELRILIGKLKRRLREQASIGDFTPSQLSVLRRLDGEGPTTVTALARAEGMRSQSMGATISVLEAAGLVSGEPDPNDGRQTILSVTPACRKWIKAGRAAHEDWLFRSIQTKLAPEEQEELINAIELLKRIADS
jgi:DNA-binding MarR family transcriptional regulator